MKFFLALFLFPTLLVGYTHQLSICAIFKNEAPYLKEWIEYHKIVGVEHFYLFNNGSEDDYLAVLAPYVERGDVDVKEWSTVPHSWENWIFEVQPSCYEEGIALAKGHSKWLAIIDIDEFLCPLKSNTIVKLLKEYEEFGGVCFNWKIFGHAGWWILPAEIPLIESLCMRAPDNWETHRGVKSIVQPERVTGCSHPHYVKYVPPFYHVDSLKRPTIDADGRSETTCYDVLAINHYWSRSGSEFYKKLKRYRPWLPHVDPEKWKEYLHGLNAVEDHSMEPFLVKLKERLK